MGSTASLEKKVGQLLVVGCQGTQSSSEELDRFRRIGVGGVIHFKHNYESVAQIVELNNSLQKAVAGEAHRALPLFIGVDQEGGRVKRFGEPFTDFPAMAKLGELNSAKTCFEAGYVIAKELKAVGCNLNFSPVVDVPDTLDNNGLWDRALSTDPEVVASMGSAVVRGIQKGGCVGVLKHFPGHGTVNVDSHEDLPVCDKSVEELEARDWLPFKRGLRARAEAVMTAHILFPKIDEQRPATMSRKILQEYLRKELRFNKIIFSDDLEMGAIAKRYSLSEAAFLSIEAGCDQILICHKLDELETVWQHLVKAFVDGALPQSRLEESLARIEDCKKRYCLPLQYADVKLAEALVGAPSFKQVSQEIQLGHVVENGPSTQTVG